MPEVVCNTSLLQYLYQIGHLDLLPRLIGRVIVPVAVVDELAVGRAVERMRKMGLTNSLAGRRRYIARIGFAAGDG